MLVRSLTMKSRQRLAYDTTDTCATHASLIQDIRYRLPDGKMVVLMAAFQTSVFNKLNHTSTEKQCVSFSFLFFFLLIGPVVLVHKFTSTKDKYAYPFVIVVVEVVVALSSLARILGECSIIHSLPVGFFCLFLSGD